MNQEQISKKIQINKNVFNSLIKSAEGENDIQEKLSLLQFASQWACSEHTGYFSSQPLERMLSDISEDTIVSTPNVNVQKDSFLHVMTSAYSIGGHTPLANHWIQQSDLHERHSLALINQTLDIPFWLKQSVDEHHGELYQLDNSKDYLQKAQELFNIAQEYEFIILHVHMHDIIPALAFANTQFLRPVIFINHADHMFWLGASFSDMISELSSDAIAFTHLKRAPILNQVVTIPATISKDPLPNREDALEQLQLSCPHDTQIILSMASSWKYNQFDTYPFIDMAMKLLHSNTNLLFIIIGPDKDKEAIWKEAYTSSDRKICAVGYKERKDVLLYKAIANLYIDSFPFASYTSLLEFANKGIPAFSLKNEMKTLDLFKNRPNLCQDFDTLISRVESFLRLQDTQTYDLSKAIQEDYSPNSSWKKSKYKLIQNTPREHKVKWNFSLVNDIDAYDIRLYAISHSMIKKAPFSKQNSFKQNLLIALTLYKYNYLRNKTMISYLFKTVKFALKNKSRKV